MKRMIIAISVSALVLSACSSKKDANEKNFTLAIQQQLEKTPQNLCIPFAPTQDVQLTGWDAQQLQPFEAAGLITGTEMEVDSNLPATINLDGSTNPLKVKVKRYTLTTEGKKFYQETDVPILHNALQTTAFGAKTHDKRGSLCYGKVALDKVVKWSEPSQSGDVQQAQVTYLYKINNLADWAKKPEIQKVAPTIKPMLDGESKTELTQEVVLTNLGWEAANANVNAGLAR